MRVAVIGAYGLIGSYVSARLVAEGHDVIGVGRDLTQARRRFANLHWKQADLATASLADWTTLLDGASAVVNCAGALQDSPRDDLNAVHVEGVRRLAQACEVQGARLIHISAAGVETGKPTAFNTTKYAAEALVAECAGLDWIVLRPGLVIGPAAYGGTALLRGLAGFPGFAPVVHGQSRVQVVAADDVAAAVVRCLAPGAPLRRRLDLVHAEAVTLQDLVARLRGWLGFPAAPVIDLPPILARITAAGADALAFLGWRSPMRTAALAQLRMGVRGEASDAAVLDLELKSLDALLAAMPSGVQERWFARAYFAKPLILAVLFAFWMVSGLIGVTVGFAPAVATLTTAGVSQDLAVAAVVGGSVADIVLTLLLAHRRTAGLALKGMLLVTAGYLLGGALVRPDLWLDPLGPLVKSIPAAMLAVAALTTLEER